MRICDASHHLKKTSLWECGNQAEPDAELTTPVILSKATATIRASLGVNASPPDIWAALGLHLHSRLLQRKAVNITSFGAFGFGQDDELSFVQDPVFLHMTRLCLASRKRGTRVQPALSQSENMTELNLKELAAEHLQNCSKDLVKSVVASVLAWVVSWAKSGQEMRLSFLPVGEWVCDGDSVDFHFSDSFCKEVKLQEMNIKEAEAAETPLDSEGTLGNQVEDLALTGEHPTVSVLTGGKLDSGKEKTAGGRSPSTAKEAATRSGSPVARTRYKLRASTFSSKAKQLPPHDQRRFRDVALNVSSSKSTAIATKCSRKPVAHQATSRDKNQAEASAILNAVQAGDVCSGTVAAAKDTRPGTASTCKSKQRATTASRLNTQQVEIINRLLKRLSTRRGQTFQGLNALAAVLRSSKTGVISSTELSLSLRKLGVKVSSAEVKEVAEAFAHGKRGFIDTDKLLDALRGPQLSGMRLDVVTKAFRQMDPTGTGVVGVDEMVKRYDVGFLPQVREGKQSRLEALTAFLQEWASVSSANTNAITFKAFEEYYHVRIIAQFSACGSY
jgi:Ca2+-binding EF-hand superfamily protein